MSAVAARQSFPPPALTCQGQSHTNMQSAGKGGVQGGETCRTGASFWGLCVSTLCEWNPATQAKGSTKPRMPPLFIVETSPRLLRTPPPIPQAPPFFDRLLRNSPHSSET